jgi:drug/metabolite transporter (DMT)-like permease
VMFLFLLPIAITEWASAAPERRVDLLARKPDLPYRVIVHVLIAGLAWASNLLLWVSGIKFTNTVEANLFAYLHPLMLVFWLQFKPREVDKDQAMQVARPSRYEWLGTAIALIGVVIISVKNLGSLVGQSSIGSNEIIGDSICTLAACAEVVVILNRHQIKKHVPLWQYTAITTFVVIVVSSTAAVVIDGSKLFCVEDFKYCVFGWASKEWIAWMLPFGAVVGVICMPCLNYAIQYIPPLLFSCAMLLDPIFTGLLSWSAGLEGIPRAHTFAGGLVVIVGSALISWGETKRSTQPGKIAEAEAKAEAGFVRDKETNLSPSSSSFGYTQLSKEEN